MSISGLPKAGTTLHELYGAILRFFSQLFFSRFESNPPTLKFVQEDGSILFCCEALKMFCGEGKLHLALHRHDRQPWLFAMEDGTGHFLCKEAKTRVDQWHCKQPCSKTGLLKKPKILYVRCVICYMLYVVYVWEWRCGPCVLWHRLTGPWHRFSIAVWWDQEFL